MRFLKLSLLVALVAGVLSPTIGAQAVVDRGRPYNKPPASYRGMRYIWNSEWVTCGVPMHELAGDPDVHLSQQTLRSWLAVLPQFAARRLAYVIETGDAGAGYVGRELAAAIDGCRNGILFAYYHP